MVVMMLVMRLLASPSRFLGEKEKKRKKKHLVGEGVSASEEAIGDGSLSDLKAILSMMLMNDSKKVLFFLRYFII